MGPLLFYYLIVKTHLTLLLDRNFSFNDVHIAGAEKIARLAKENGVSKLVHVSAFNANPNSDSLYLKSKALGEQAVLSQFPDATIVRPTTMYGAEDRFFNRWCQFMVFLMSIPLINGGRTKVRPVYVSFLIDVPFSLTSSKQLLSIFRSEMLLVRCRGWSRAMSRREKWWSFTGRFLFLGSLQPSSDKFAPSRPNEFAMRQIIDVIVEIAHRSPLVYSAPKPLAK